MTTHSNSPKPRDDGKLLDPQPRSDLLRPDPLGLDPLDEAVPLNGHAGPSPDDPDETDEVINEEESNATGGALPATDDEDNDNDNDDARERDIPDHLVRDEDE